MSSGWFADLGWWDQHAAYAAFDSYRADPTLDQFDNAITLSLPIIRVVYSTQKFKVSYAGDEDDLISHAALTITKALPKMIEKPVEKLDNDKKYMRYLFTCVINAFYREYDILHGKQNKLTRKILEEQEPEETYAEAHNVKALEASLTLKRIPQQLLTFAMECVRFEGGSRKICKYILEQMIDGREIAKSVLQLMGCKDRHFFIHYCESILLQAFLLLRKRKPLTGGATFEGQGIHEDFESSFDLGFFMDEGCVEA